MAVRLTAALSMLACEGAALQPGAPGEGGAGAGPSAWTSYCFDRYELCGVHADTCGEAETCARGLLRDEIEEDFIACRQQTCDINQCFQGLDEYPLSPEAAGFLAMCEDYPGDCYEPLEESFCSHAYYYSAELLNELVACVQGPAPCSESVPCVEAVFQRVGECRGW